MWLELREEVCTTEWRTGGSRPLAAVPTSTPGCYHLTLCLAWHAPQRVSRHVLGMLFVLSMAVSPVTSLAAADACMFL
jgi:hypothetical protein